MNRFKVSSRFMADFSVTIEANTPMEAMLSLKDVDPAVILNQIDASHIRLTGDVRAELEDPSKALSFLRLSH